MKSNLVIGGLLVFLVGLIGYGVSVLLKMETDQFNQQNLKPFETGSQTRFPLGSVTTDGHENTAVSDWFEWSTKELAAVSNSIPKAGSGVDLKLGWQQYHNYCQFCHGTGLAKNRWGLAKAKMNDVGMLAPDLPALTPFHDNAFLFLKIENGGTVMPRLGHIVTPERRWQIIAYLRSIEPGRKDQDKITDQQSSAGQLSYVD